MKRMNRAAAAEWKSRAGRRTVCRVALLVAALGVGIFGAAMAESADLGSATLKVVDRAVPPPAAATGRDLWQRFSNNTLDAGSSPRATSSFQPQSQSNRGAITTDSPPRLSLQIGQPGRPSITEGPDRVVFAPEGVEIRLKEIDRPTTGQLRDATMLGQYGSPTRRHAESHVATRIELNVGEASSGRVVPVEHRELAGRMTGEYSTTSDVGGGIPNRLPGGTSLARPLACSPLRNELRAGGRHAESEPMLQPLLSDDATANPLRNRGTQTQRPGTPLRMGIETAEPTRPMSSPLRPIEASPAGAQYRELNQLRACDADRFDRLMQTAAVQSEEEVQPSAEVPRPLPAQPAERLPRVVPMPEPETLNLPQESVAQPTTVPCWEARCKALEKVLGELFPSSQVKLVPVADELFVAGRAASVRQAGQILAVVRDQVGSDSIGGAAATSDHARVVNMLRVPEAPPAGGAG